jgi:hypothetical protein
MMSAISGRVVFCIGHIRDDLTDRRLKFWSVYSYLVVYEPESRPLTNRVFLTW